VIVSTNSFLRLFLAPAALPALLLACGDDETGTEDHTPVDFAVAVDGAPAEAPFTLVFGETVRIRVQFFNENDEDLDNVEDSHFAGLTFNPTSLATAARVSDHNYQFDVTATAVGPGTVAIGYGHSEDADEVTFSGIPINVVANTGENPE
jgi:hypothetical protein